MRTTLDIAEDVLLAAKERSRREKRPMGELISEWARRSLAPKQTTKIRNGVPLFASAGRAKVVTMEWVNRLRDENP